MCLATHAVGESVTFWSRVTQEGYSFFGLYGDRQVWVIRPTRLKGGATTCRCILRMHFETVPDRPGGRYLRKAAFLAIVSPFWFLGVYLLVSSRNPTFSHRIDPISTLGSLGQPGAAVWNVLGFMLPGLVIAGLGLRIRQAFPGKLTASLAGMSLAISGFLVVVAGLFPGNPLNPAALTNLVHDLSGWASLSAFLIAGVITPWVLWSRSGLSWISVGPFSIVFGSLAYQLWGGPQWWLGQRVGFSAYFLWVALIGSVMTFPSVDGLTRTPAVSRPRLELIPDLAVS